MTIIHGDSQHVYVDSITVNYHRYERQDGGDAMNGTGFAVVEFSRLGSDIRMLPGEQLRGMSPVKPESLTELVGFIERDAERLAPFIDPDPFPTEEGCGEQADV